jgi:hypothetical protein
MSDGGKHKRRGRKTNRTKRRTTALPRHRQPTINHEKLEAYLAAAAKFVDALEHDGAELRKSRLKLDEIVHLLKTGTDPASIQDYIESAVEQTRATLRASGSLLGFRQRHGQVAVFRVS